MKKLSKDAQCLYSKFSSSKCLLSFDRDSMILKFYLLFFLFISNQVQNENNLILYIYFDLCTHIDIGPLYEECP